MQVDLTIIGARNIVAGDLNGKSDGYVKFKHGDKKYKTKVYKPSLSPTWNEKFNLNVKVGDTFKFEIMDHDTFSSDDELGVVEYKVTKPFVNGDTKFKIMPISTKGTFYFSFTCYSGGISQPEKSVKATKKMVLQIDVPRMQVYPLIFPQSDSVVVSRVGIETPHNKLQKGEKSTSLSEVTCSDFFLVKARVNNFIQYSCQIRFGYTGKDQAFTTGKWRVPDLRGGEKIECAVPSKKFVTFHTVVKCLKSIYNSVVPIEIPPAYDPMIKDVYRYELVVAKAEKLKGKDTFSKSDPYVVISTNKSKRKRKTVILMNNEDPVYQAGFKVKATPGSDIKFEIYDKDSGKKDDFLGDCTYTIPVDLKENELEKAILDISKGKNAKLYIRIRRMRDLTASYASRFKGYVPPMPQGYPAYQFAGYPPQGAYPGYPPAGYPPQAYPGYPPQGAYPGYPPQGYPPQQPGEQPPQGQQPPPQGYPPAGYPPQGAYPGYPPQQPGQQPPQGAYPGYPPQGYPPQQPQEQQQPPVVPQQPQEQPAQQGQTSTGSRPNHFLAVRKPKPVQEQPVQEQQ